MIDDAAQRHYLAIDVDFVPMPLLPIVPAIPAIENCSRRVEGTSQGTAVNAVNKPGTIAGDGLARNQRPQLVDQFIAQLVIGVERQNPRTLDMDQAEIALPGEVDEFMHEYRNPRMAAQNLQGSVGAAAVDHDDALRPSQLGERALDIGHLVTGEDQRRDLIEHRHRYRRGFTGKV